MYRYLYKCFAFNDLKLISGWSVWLILKTNIHLITINNHLSITHSRSLARVWIFKSVHGRMIAMIISLIAKIWKSGEFKKIEYQLSENVLWFVRQHDFNAKNREISNI